MKIFGREPALIAALLGSVIAFVGAFVVHLTAGQQTVLNAAVVAALGLVTAIGVEKDKLVPALVGLAQAVLNTVMAFGLHLTAEKQAVAMTLVSTLVAALIIRPQVTAKVPG